MLSGYLGSGKTTVLNHVLHNRAGLKVAVIVNDMSEVNIDAALIKGEGNLSRTEEQLVELSNGCICCTLREDLIVEIERLTEQNIYDHILIESSGISEPTPVAQTFTYADDSLQADLTKLARLDCMVTVVDANRFWHDYASGESLLDRQQGVGLDDTRDVVDLLIDQIEMCDVLLLNKCDLVQEEDLSKLEAVLRKIQPGAKLIRTVQGQVDPKAILNTGLFDFDRASMSPGWIQELQQEHHTPETDEYGISSFVYRRSRPFHPERLAEYLSNWPHEVVRAKGLAWIAAKGDYAATLSQAGPSIEFGPAGYWVAALSKEDQEMILQDEPEIAKKWDELWGDRASEIVMIGMDMNETDLIGGLDQCLLSEEEMIMDWSKFTNPLPWSIEADI